MCQMVRISKGISEISGSLKFSLLIFEPPIRCPARECISTDHDFHCDFLACVFFFAWIRSNIYIVHQPQIHFSFFTSPHSLFSSQSAFSCATVHKDLIALSFSSCQNQFKRLCWVIVIKCWQGVYFNSLLILIHFDLTYRLLIACWCLLL